MFLYGVKDMEFEIYYGDMLVNDWDMFCEINLVKKFYFDVVVVNLLFSYCWDLNEVLGEDVWFKNYGLVFKLVVDFVFLLYGFYYFKDDGVMVIILLYGVFFCGGMEVKICCKLLEDGYIDIVIGLLVNLFYLIGILVCIFVLKKCKKFDDVLFINVFEQFE